MVKLLVLADLGNAYSILIRGHTKIMTGLKCLNSCSFRSVQGFPFIILILNGNFVSLIMLTSSTLEHAVSITALGCKRLDYGRTEFQPLSLSLVCITGQFRSTSHQALRLLMFLWKYFGFNLSQTIKERLRVCWFM